MWHRAEVIRSGSHLTIGNNRASQVSANDNLKASGSFIKVDPSGVTELAEAEKGDSGKIPEARGKAWNKLKELGALPRPEKSTTAADLLAEYGSHPPSP